ncbi:MAG: ABC transporter substrate-binding protein [Rhodospirillaceae bacterium]|nr:ABC transporter substrate-binding protein [Rhodospirillaceae bacterium]|tara:strand:- start:22668 stop:23600 length:933 start_codon:yes stop_codon:yes gene_type:complete
MATSNIRLIGFPGTGLLPLFVGIDKGQFKERGVTVDLERTPSSMYQAQKLVGGEFDIACSAVDNYIAYQEGAGEVELDREPDLFVFMGSTQIELSFVVAKGIESFEDLKGKTLAMDALTTGFAFVLYRMLDNAGLTPDDYEMVSVGATPHRWEAVQEGEHAGTLLIEPFTGQARAGGYTILESSLQTFKNYPGQMFGAMRGWANENRPAMISFIQGYLDALDWTLDPANKAEAATILGANMPQMPEKAVGPALEKLLVPETGLVPMGKVDMEGLKTVLEIRSQYAPQGKQLTDTEKYLDLSFYEEAISGR